MLIHSRIGQQQHNWLTKIARNYCCRKFQSHKYPARQWHDWISFEVIYLELQWPCWCVRQSNWTVAHRLLSRMRHDQTRLAPYHGSSSSRHRALRSHAASMSPTILTLSPSASWRVLSLNFYLWRQFPHLENRIPHFPNEVWLRLFATPSSSLPLRNRMLWMPMWSLCSRISQIESPWNLDLCNGKLMDLLSARVAATQHLWRHAIAMGEFQCWQCKTNSNFPHFIIA